jgi:hypothetical protein
MNLTADALRALIGRHTWLALPRVAVESGTFEGERTVLLAGFFHEVHTIELSEHLYDAAAARLIGLRHVTCHFGDSARIVPELAAALQEPVLWYLDAHWFSLNRGKSRAGYARDAAAQIAPGPLPLWDELAAIAARPYADVIAVDDARDFGRSEPTPEWRDISLGRIAAYFPHCAEAVILGDQAVVFR